MNSIRPFATVTILVVIGIGLYMIINTGEPIPPEGAADAMLAIPEIEEDLTALVDEGTTEGFSDAGPVAPFRSAGEVVVPPPWDGPPPGAATTGGLDPSGTSSAPPLPVESPTSPLPRSAEESLPMAEGEATPVGGRDAFSAQLQNQIEGAATPHSVSNPYVQAGSSGAQDIGNIPAAVEANRLASAAERSNSLPQVEEGGVERPATTFSVVRAAVQETLRRRKLSQALLMLSEFYGDPQLTPAENQELNTLLSQLAGTVIYSRSHELEQPHVVQPDETLADVAEAYNVTPALLAKINGLPDPSRVTPGTELKVVRGPFHAILDQNAVRLVLDGRYAGRFLAQGPRSWPAESWIVQQKVPAGGTSASSQFASSGKHLVLVPAESESGAPPVAIVGDAAAPAGDSGPVVRVSRADLADLYDILSIGSRVTVRR